MTATTDIITADTDPADLPDPGTGGAGARAQDSFTERPMIPVELLTAHPGNVREDKQADRQFCQSVAAAGIITPLEITTSPDHDGYIVIDGNIRLDAAVKVGLGAVPYVFSAGTADDAGQQYLHMLISSRFRRDLTVHEEAAALFSASEAGMTRTEIRRATGLKASEVRAGIAAGSLSPKTRELTEASGYEWTLEDLALLAPFQDDPDTTARILEAVRFGQPLAYITQKITDERHNLERHARQVADLEAQGITVLDYVPEHATSLQMLLPDRTPGTDEPDGSDQPDTDPSPDTDEDDGTEAAEQMDPVAHLSCPGSVAVLRSWQDEPSWWCLDADAHGHASRYQQPQLPAGPGSSPAAGAGGGDPEPDPSRRLVIEGNKAWVTAGTVRQRWVAEFLTRKAPPPGTGTLVQRFVTAQILAMPEPLRQALGGIRHTGLYQTLSGPEPDDAQNAAQPRLWMLALAPIAVAYEDQMTGTTTSRATWRTDRCSQCPRTDAGTWLRFLADAGYPLSPIEQAVADDTPYLGDTPSPAQLNEPAPDEDEPEPEIIPDPGDDGESREDIAPGDHDQDDGGSTADEVAPLAA